MKFNDQNNSKTEYTTHEKTKTMKNFGDEFVEKIPECLESIAIKNQKKYHQQSIFDEINDIQQTMHDVINNSITIESQAHAESTFKSFIKKNNNNALLKFFNGWNEIHKTTSLVSAKVVMRLASNAHIVNDFQKSDYMKSMAHMHEVTKDDFGLGHSGHDGMFSEMTKAFNSENWSSIEHKVTECNNFSNFLYQTGVSNHHYPVDSDENKESLLEAMMVSVASEIWNGREFNFFAQFIEEKINSFGSTKTRNAEEIRNAKAYVIGHSKEIEIKHGLHALAAIKHFNNANRVKMDLEKLKTKMIDYNKRVGIAFSALNKALEN